MKLSIGVYLLLVLNINVFSQKELKVESTKGIIVEYEVIKKGETEIRDGSYIKYRDNIFGLQVLESGQYKEGNKSGFWKCYFEVGFGKAKNSLKEEGSYSYGKKHGVWRTYYPDSASDIVNKKNYTSKNKIDSIELKIENNLSKLKSQGLYLNNKKSSIWNYFNNAGQLVQQYNHTSDSLIMDIKFNKDIFSERNHSALFIGGDEQLNIHFLSGFNFGYLNDKIKEGETSVTYSFHISEEGKLNLLTISKSRATKALVKSVKKQLLQSEDHWLSARKNGEIISDQIQLMCSVNKVKIDNLTKFNIKFSQIH